MKLVGTRLSKLSIFVGLLGILPQVLSMPAIQAQSIVEQRLCGHDGRYVVFAIRPLGNGHWDDPPQTNSGIGGIKARNNLLLAHAHIIFCNGHRIERNVGFGGDAGGQRFSEEVSARDYFPFDDQRYDSDIISNILGPDSCRVSEAGTYGVLTNNCQDFAARVRQEYWKRIFVGTWEVQNEPNNRWQMQVTWNSQANRYEGVLTRQGQVSQNVGFSINELVWTATLAPNLGQMNVQQKWRWGSNGTSTKFEWVPETIDLDKSTFDTLVYTTGLAARRVQ